MVDRVQVTRGLACLLLVLFHVVGGKVDDGLRIADASAGRQMLDVLLYVRMPLFAFISGYVYALKPLDPARPVPFLQGKLRRLALPLLTATTIFYLAALVQSPQLPADAALGLLHAYVFSYGIYWFLQAMLLIFLVLPLLERFLLHSPIGCAATILVSFLLTVPAEPFDLLSINGAAFLAPFFLLGITARRFFGPLNRGWTWALLAILVVAFALHIHNVATLPAHVGARRGTWLSLLIGGITPLLLVAHAPRIALLARIGHSSFAIFLFHIFFIVAMRLALRTIGIDDFAIHLLAGLAAAIAGPMLLEALLTKTKVTRRLFLGLR